MPQQQLDPQIVDLAKSIRTVESNGNFKASGKSGESGAYQWMPSNWANASKTYLGANVPIAQATPQQQNEVAYKQLQQVKKEHPDWNVGQVASWWNSGSPDHYMDGHSGTNAQGVNYDTPAYAKKVAQQYQQLKAQRMTVGGGTDVPNAQLGTAQGQQNPSFIDDVSKTGSDVLGGLGDAANKILTGGPMGIVNGAIQGAGAVAGGLGSLTNNVLEHTPLVGTAYKGLEGLIGQGVGALANTNTGKGLISNYQSFAQAHPEIAADVNAGINIASAIPLFKGLGVAKTAVTDAVGTAIKGSAEKAAAEEISSAVGATAKKGLVSAAKRGVDPVKELVSNKQFLPDIVRSGDKFVYDTTKGNAALNASLDADETALQTMLKQGVKKNIGVDLEQVRAKVLKDVAKEYSMSGNYKPAINAVNDYFDSFGQSTGGRKIIDLNELNGMKRDVRNAVFNVGGDVRGTATADIKYQIGQSLMKQVEATAAQAGVKGVGALNKIMSGKIEALKVLKSITGKAVKGGGGAAREVVKDVAGGVGEMAGNAMGVPLAGTFAGRGLAGLVGRRLPKTALGKLKRAVPLSKTIKQAAPRIVGGLVGQGVARQSQAQK